MKPELTIIIPCYNCESTLEDAVNSCYNQGLRDFEIVMVDDGSTDNTHVLMNELAKQHNQIKLFFHEKNKGGGATRNTAVKNSHSDVIFCLDSDDMLPPNTLSKMLDYLLLKKCDGVTIHRSIKFNGNNINDVHRIDVSPYLNQKIPLNSLFSKKIFHPLYVTFMFTRKAFDKMGGYPTSHGYDTQGFGWRFLCSGLVAYTCPDAEYLHRIHFNESYFLREYRSGKMNFNWRDIFIEHYYIFNKKTLDYILKYNCSNFSRNIMDDVINNGDQLIINVENELGSKHAPLQVNLPAPLYVSSNSLKGLYFRISNKLNRILNKTHE